MSVINLALSASGRSPPGGRVTAEGRHYINVIWRKSEANYYLLAAMAAAAPLIGIGEAAMCFGRRRESYAGRWQR